MSTREQTMRKLYELAIEHPEDSYEDINGNPVNPHVNKVGAIKAYRALTDAGLAQAKNTIESVIRGHNIVFGVDPPTANGADTTLLDRSYVYHDAHDAIDGLRDSGFIADRCYGLERTAEVDHGTVPADAVRNPPDDSLYQYRHELNELAKQMIDNGHYDQAHIVLHAANRIIMSDEQ